MATNADKMEEKNEELTGDKTKDNSAEEAKILEESDALIIGKRKKVNIFLVLLTIASLICLSVYVILMLTSFARGNVGDKLYFTYLVAATAFVFLMCLVFTSNASLFLTSVKYSLPDEDEYDNEDKDETKDEVKPRLITIEEKFSIENTIKDLHDIQDNTILSVAGMYFFFVFLFLGLSSFAWAIIVAHYHQANPFMSGYEYIAVNVCSGFLAPIFLLTSVTISMVLVSYYTKDRLSMRNVIPKLFNSLKLCQKINASSNKNVNIIQSEDGIPGIDPTDFVPEDSQLVVEYEYWDIKNHFKWDLVERKNWYKWLEPHISTWALWIIICISVVLSFAQFIDATVIREIASPLCLPQFDCFIAVHVFDFEHFPCDTGNLTELGVTGTPIYYCFKFQSFGFDSNVILAIGNTYALYLVQIALFDKILGGYHTFIHLKLDVQFTLTYIIVPTGTAILIFISNLINNYEAVLYDLVRTWNLFNILLYHAVVAVFMITYRWQKQWIENHPTAKAKSKYKAKKAKKTNDIPLVI